MAAVVPSLPADAQPMLPAKDSAAADDQEPVTVQNAGAPAAGMTCGGAASHPVAGAKTCTQAEQAGMQHRNAPAPGTPSTSALSFCLVKLRCLGKGRIQPGAAVRTLDTQDAQSASRTQLPALKHSKAIENAQSGVEPDFARCGTDPNEIDICEDDAERSLPLTGAASTPIMASFSHQMPPGECNDGHSEAAAVSVGRQISGGTSDWGSEPPTRKELQDQPQVESGLGQLIGYVTSCTPEGVTSCNALAMCSLQGLYKGWQRQNERSGRLLLRRHAGLQLVVHNVRGGSLIFCKIIIVLS
ncbi:hypothetical protein WJX74_009794 [Apatococcus lobatus]|uniref:Uncharacterized protein n=1 Tax=Apatococcus lobatus TaxID=904363 RepID=A0AAW1RPX4_9CHLO